LPVELKVQKEIEKKGGTAFGGGDTHSLSRVRGKACRIQREQFKRLGVLGDWEHPYLTCPLNTSTRWWRRSTKCGGAATSIGA